MKPEDVRALVDMEVQEPTWEREARGLRLCIQHLIRDAEELKLPLVIESLQSAASAIDAALVAENGGA